MTEEDKILVNALEKYERTYLNNTPDIVPNKAKRSKTKSKSKLVT